jgi:hypothetical protein
METLVASVVVQVRRTDSPFWIEVRSALIVAVGFIATGAGGGAGGGAATGFFLQAEIKRARKQKVSSRVRWSG